MLLYLPKIDCMKKFLLNSIFLFAFSLIQAQSSFEWIAIDDTIQTIPVADSIVAFDGDLKNKTNRTLDILITKQAISNPRNWPHYVCVAGNCYAPNQDTLRINVGPNETIEMKYDIDVIAPNNGDVATFKVTIINNQNTDEIITRSFRINVNQTNKSKSISSIFSIYPNPVSHTLFIKMNSQNLLYSEILNINGQSISIQEGNTIKVKELNPGIYLLKIYTTEGYIEYHKFIKE